VKEFGDARHYNESTSTNYIHFRSAFDWLQFVSAPGSKGMFFADTINLNSMFPMIRRYAHTFLVAALAMLSACAPLAKVSETKPNLGGAYGTVPQLRRSEQAIADGQNAERSSSNTAIGFYLSGVEAASAELRKNSKNRLALRDYNFALSRMFAVIRDSHLDPWTRPLRVPGPSGEYVLTHRPHPNRLWKPQEFDLIPADELDVRGKFVLPRNTRQGAGASLVAVRSEQTPEARQRFLGARIYFAVTAVAHFSGRKCEIEFVDPLAVETVNVSGRSLPAGADFTAPLALGLSRERPEKIGLRAMLNPETFAEKARLTRLQPYDPKKIPVLFVHGLQATPATWAPMVNELWSDPVVRRNCQLWVFSYPTGYPVPYSALLLRRELDALNRVFPDHRPIVLVGHSMGGIISRLMITDTDGDKVWRIYFGKSPAQTNLSPQVKALLMEGLIFKRRPEVARVIFVSTPHRGSIIASNPIGRIASSIIRKPFQLVSIGPEMLLAMATQEDPTVMRMTRMPNSIDTLAPNNRFVKIMNTLPLPKNIPYHSIIGDRGRGDTPNSSDGVVAYWSSHVDGAKSEKIVPSSHGANQDPQGITEVDRILRQHIGGKGS
jgi:triacylglycerol esterase/lipase EstA (alpha/beta hydrolase family)